MHRYTTEPGPNAMGSGHAISLAGKPDIFPAASVPPVQRLRWHSDVASVSPALRTAAMVGVLMACDLLMLGLAFTLCMIIQAPLVAHDARLFTLWQGVVFSLASVSLFAVIGLYPGIPVSSGAHARRVVTVLFAVCMVLCGFIIHDSARFGALALTSLLLVLAAGLVLTGRTTVRLMFPRWNWWGYPVLVVGSRKAVRAVVGYLRTHPYVGLKVMAAVVDRPARNHRLPVPVCVGYDQVRRLCRQTGIQHGVLAVDDLALRSECGLMGKLTESFAHLFVIPRNFRTTGFDLSIGDAGGVMNLHLRRRSDTCRMGGWRDRIEWLLTMPIIVLLTPLLLLIAAAIKLDSKGPVFYRQARLGFKHRPFSVLKFRTMAVDADKKLHALLAANPKLREQYNKYHKLDNDPRVTRVGRILRKLSFDELPQLLNILRGEMGLVGPRPYAMSELEKMGAAADTILQVCPGLTGYWQAFARNRASFYQRIVMDVYYIRHRSLSMDLYIVFRTAWVVLLGWGSR